LLTGKKGKEKKKLLAWHTFFCKNILQNAMENRKLKNLSGIERNDGIFMLKGVNFVENVRTKYNLASSL
jgi:hypothetical protein